MEKKIYLYEDYIINGDCFSGKPTYSLAEAIHEAMADLVHITEKEKKSRYEVITEFTCNAEEGESAKDALNRYWDEGGDLNGKEVCTICRNGRMVFAAEQNAKDPGYYEYSEVLTSYKEQPNSINADHLVGWFVAHGESYWNGESYDADGYTVTPVFEQIDEDEFVCVGYSIEE